MAETRFADLVADAGPALRAGVDALDGPSEPVVARVGQPWENVLLQGASYGCLWTGSPR